MINRRMQTGKTGQSGADPGQCGRDQCKACSGMTSSLILVRRPFDHLGCMALTVKSCFAFAYEPSMETFAIGGKVILRMCFLPSSLL